MRAGFLGGCHACYDHHVREESTEKVHEDASFHWTVIVLQGLIWLASVIASAVLTVILLWIGLFLAIELVL